MTIHPTAIIEDGVELAEGVEIGPLCHIGRGVRIGRGTRLVASVTAVGHTIIGQGNLIYPYSVIGTPPQDITYRGEPTTVELGDGNTIRELITINAGTMKGGGRTSIGNNNFIMAMCHVGHDCILEDSIIMASGAMLGGHTKVECNANIGGMVGVHHFVTIGRYSFIGGMSSIRQDVPPYMMVEGVPPKTRSVNVVGLKRKGFPEATIELLKEAHRLIFRQRTSRNEALEKMAEQVESCKELQVLFEFLKLQEAGRFGRAREALRHPGGTDCQ